VKKILSATVENIDAKVVEVETSFTKGLPSFSIVGMASADIQESKERVKSALLTNNFKFPPLKITINLSPSDISKKGTHFDLPIALSIALYDKDINFDDFYIFGELGLDGSLKKSSNIFVLILSLLKTHKIKKVLVPYDIASEISVIPNIEVYAVKTLKEACDFFIISENQKPFSHKSLEFDFLEISDKRYYFIKNFALDFDDVKGQNIAIRSALISCAGFHNILFEGNPGCGKSMIAKRMQYILPPLSLDEILESVKLNILDNKDIDFSPIRTFRSPHNSSTAGSIFGGGSSKNAKIGEVALANEGVLFFDELPHFGKKILEQLREPLEDNVLLISRVNSKIKYPAKFLFVSAQNPCPCGNLLSQNKECRCSEVEIKRYKNKLSDPFLDRIDIFVQMQEINSNDNPVSSSSQMFEKIKQAFVMQKSRNQQNLNGKMSDEEIKKFCVLTDELSAIINMATQRFDLSFRAINKVLKVARTIADLENSKDIQKEHLMEALSFRRR
jgi:magnesium chelatase family protein